ncbi:diadenylate cyclase CdaA [Thermoleptolyngbya sp.]
MGSLLKQWLTNPGWTQSLLLHGIDVVLVLMLTYMVLVIIGDRRTLWMVRGLIVLMLASALSKALSLQLLSFVLEKLVIGSAVAMAFMLQAEFRRLLEQLGRGEIWQLLKPATEALPKSDSVIDEIVDAVKELSQNRTGALLVLETSRPIDERDFSVPGVKLNAEVSKELLQTIFQTSTLLHDGAVLIRGSRLAAAGVILPLSERSASRQLGTRHRAAMGITERVEQCLCIVVSEETGSISLAEGGILNRPLTSSKLRELLIARFSQSVEREPVAPQLRSLGRQFIDRIKSFLPPPFRVSKSASRRKNDSKANRS